MPVAPYTAQAGAGVVVDAGFSFTNVVPFFEGQPILQVRGGLKHGCACCGASVLLFTSPISTDGLIEEAVGLAEEC